MAPRPKPDDLKVIQGTFRGDRAHPPATTPIPGDPEMPFPLKPQAKKLWHHRVAEAKRQGVNLRGTELALAQLCVFEASMIAEAKKGGRATASELNAYRTFVREFYGTPASRFAKADGDTPPENPFLAHGCKPAT